MKKALSVPLAATAVLMLAQIKAAVEAFDRGESNVRDALEEIVVAAEAYRTASVESVGRKRAKRKAALVLAESITTSAVRPTPTRTR